MGCEEPRSDLQRRRERLLRTRVSRLVRLCTPLADAPVRGTLYESSASWGHPVGERSGGAQAPAKGGTGRAAISITVSNARAERSYICSITFALLRSTAVLPSIAGLRGPSRHPACRDPGEYDQAPDQRGARLEIDSVRDMRERSLARPQVVDPDHFYYVQT